MDKLLQSIINMKPEEMIFFGVIAFFIVRGFWRWYFGTYDVIRRIDSIESKILSLNSITQFYIEKNDNFRKLRISIDEVIEKLEESRFSQNDSYSIVDLDDISSQIKILEIKIDDLSNRLTLKNI
jgi:hypothetical protein